jgi:hypothetical protein
MTPDYLEWAAVFAAMFALDFFWARYTAAVTDKAAAKAAGWAAFIILVSGFVTTSYVHDHWLLIPAAFGAFAGTYAAIRFRRS